MSIDNFGHRDVLEEFLSTDDGPTRTEYQPQSRRERREMERLAADKASPSPASDQEYEEDFASGSNAAGDVTQDEGPEEKSQAAEVAEQELMRLLGTDTDKDDDHALPPAQTHDPLEDDAEPFASSDDFRASVDAPAPEHDHVAAYLEDDDFIADPVAAEQPQPEPDADNGVDFGAWMDADDEVEADDNLPSFTGQPTDEPNERPEVTDRHYSHVDIPMEPYVPVQTTAIPQAVYTPVEEVPEPDEELPSFPVDAPRHDQDDDDRDDDHEGDPDDDDGRYEEEPLPGDSDEHIDLVPERRELKAGWFSGKQEKEDAREERDSVNRLNELREKIGAALATEQRLSTRISDLTEEVEMRESLLEVRRQIESESSRLEEIRNEVERVSVNA